MRAYSARHITRLASYSGPVTNGDNLMELIDFDKDFTNPKIFKMLNNAFAKKRFIRYKKI